MPLCAAAPVDVTEKQSQELEALVRQRHAPQSLVLRARIVLLADAGLGVRETAAPLGLWRRTIQRWRERWHTSADLAVTERLSDAPRPGTPPTFTPEQICAIIALACESPSRGDHPLTHWTQPDLAAEASAREIVSAISPHSVGCFLRELSLKPHRLRGWLNSPRSENFEARCRDVCETCRLAPQRAAAGIQTRSIDEMNRSASPATGRPDAADAPRAGRAPGVRVHPSRYTHPHRGLRRGDGAGQLPHRSDPHRSGLRSVSDQPDVATRRADTLASGHGQS